MNARRYWIFAALLLAWGFAWADVGVALAQVYPTGLVAQFRSASGQQFERIDAQCDAVWQTANQYDERLSADQSVKIVWRGLLRVNLAGKYRLAAQAKGKVQVTIDRAARIFAESDQATLHQSPEFDLALGYRAIEIEYEATQPAGQIQLYWQGPRFQWEPITAAYLAHDATTDPGDAFERGRILARGLRCAACHSHVGESLRDSQADPRDSILPAPELKSLADNLQPEWLVDWLSQTSTSSQSDDELIDDVVTRRMPHFGLSRQAAADIAQALLNASQKGEAFIPSRDFESKEKSKSKDKKAVRTKPDAIEGRNVVLTRGCLACHSIRSAEVGLRDPDDEALNERAARLDYFTYQVFGGGDLSGVADKRPADFFSRWLARPESISATHRMPVASLTDLEREDIALYLSSLGNGKNDASQKVTGDAKRGVELIRQHRCAACHTLTGLETRPTGATGLETRPTGATGLETRPTGTTGLGTRPTAQIPLSKESDWDGGCLGSAKAEKNLPGFGLTAGQRQALKAYWTGRAPSLATNPRVTAPLAADLLMAESNCFACHARQAHAGLAPRATQIIDQFRDLAQRLPAMLPPSLNGVGDKLHESALASAIARSEDPHRPWLDVRMPKYPFREGQVRAIVESLVEHDRMPAIDQSPKVQLPNDVVTRSAAARLVTSEGFGCQSCHQIGNQPSPTVALNARGTDLTMLGKRIRQSWFDRWVRNPVRMVPRMEMPAIQLPVHGVLGDDINRQIDAVWEMLNTPDFQPPAPAPVRVVRKHNLPGRAEPAHVLTDVLETSRRNYLRPLIVGFQNRHNLLIDLERGEIGKWWIGDTARELTRGKSWYWELGGQPLGTQFDSLVRFELIDPQDERWKPKAREQFVMELDAIEHTESGLVVNARMHFAKGDQFLTVPLTINLEPQTGDKASQIEASIQFATPPNYRVYYVLGEEGAKWDDTTVGPLLYIDDNTSVATVDWSKRHARVENKGIRVAAESPSSPIDLKLRFWTMWPVDQFQETAASASGSTAPSTQAVTSSPGPTAINLVPGFDGVQLPLPRTEMPTALAWHQGRLVVGSLKGRVCFARDSDADGLADTWDYISDDLPAPYGLASSGNSIDVLAKYGLVRLTPTGSVTAPWKMQVVADGWGYTADYHDWAVGLVKDERDNYLMALPCQQDDRTPSAARLRGTIQRLIPQTPTSNDPRSFRLETVAAGQRFPMGLALNRAGQLYATDNQGNYNPFNELNHIQAGKRYGFINKLENKPGFNPPLESPAVNLPHPWTRSVNGICFLETPASAGQPNLFGPFEGHVIGCEYNGLSLIRMSLEEVDGVMQGAAYLFSRPVKEGEANFEGPVVCAVSPEGDLVVGNIHDSGWGGGQNTGSIVRLRPNGMWQPGIAEVKALPDGLRVIFTSKVDPSKAVDTNLYTIRSYRRVSTPAYGGNDQDERQEQVQAVTVIGGGTGVDLKLNELREDCVYELRISQLGDQPLFPDEAHYNMKKVPKPR